MDDAKKPRSDSKLDGLSSSQRAELVRLLADGSSYKQTIEWLGAECMVTCSLSALTPFYKRHVVPLLKERRDYAAAQAEAIVAQVGAIDWDVASRERLRQLAFRELNREDPDVETVEKLTRLAMKSRELDQGERRIRLLEDNAASAKAKLKELTRENKGGLTAETLKIIEEAAGLL